MAPVIVVQQYAVILKATLLILGMKERLAKAEKEIQEIQSLVSRIQIALGENEGMEEINIAFSLNDPSDLALFYRFEEVSQFGNIQFAEQAFLAGLVNQLI